MSGLKRRPRRQAQRGRPEPSLLSIGTSGRRYKSGVGMTAKRRVDGSGTWGRSPGPATRGECQAAAWKAALQKRCAIMRSPRSTRDHDEYAHADRAAPIKNPDGFD